MINKVCAGILLMLGLCAVIYGTGREGGFVDDQMLRTPSVNGVASNAYYGSVNTLEALTYQPQN